MKPIHYIDIHTHKAEVSGEVLSVCNLDVPMHFCRCGLDMQNYYYSLGIHPWTIRESLLSEHLRYIEENGRFEKILAIGECGLDKLTQTPWALQEKAFCAQILIAEKLEKPMILHCVKAFDELLQLKNEIKPMQNWLIHGFRGKPQQMEQLIAHGFYLTFGAKYNEDTLRTVPMNRFLLETDDASEAIEEVYAMVARSLQIPESELKEQMQSNFNALFPRIEKNY